MAVTLSALRTEILTDPIGIGFDTLVQKGEDTGITDLLNSVSVNVSFAATSTVERSVVTALTLQQQVVAAEYLVLSAAARELWNALLTTAAVGIAISNTLIRGQAAAVFSAGTTTRSNFVALQTRQCARSETLFGENVFVTSDQVNKARTGQF